MNAVAVPRGRGALVVAIAAAALVAAGAGVWWRPPHGTGVWAVVWELAGGAGFAAAGVVVLLAGGPRTPGWLLLAGGVVLLAGPATGSGLVAGAGLVAVPPALLRVVEPRPVPRLLAGADVAIVAAGAAGVIAGALGRLDVALGAVTAAATVALCAGWLLFEVTAGEDRRRVLWIVFGAAVTVPAGMMLLVVFDGPGARGVAAGAGLAVLTLVLPACAALALVRPRALDVRAVARRGTLLVVMFALVGAVYVGVETLTEITTGGAAPRWVRVLTVFAIAAAFRPAMGWVRGSIDELLFGAPPDPIDTLARLGSHLAGGAAPGQWLDTLRAALGVPAIELRDETGAVVARAGREPGPPAGGAEPVTAVTPLRADGRPVGDLVVTLPPDQLGLPPRTAAVLALVAAPLAQSLHAAELAGQLRASRGRVVAALEEERRRMRRDLHDGLGPTLTGIAYSADASANLLRADPDEAGRLLRGLRADAGDAIAEIRRIVYGLRPRALDELGLVGAVRQQVSHLRAADGSALAVTITAPELPELPAAVEVAAYRVAVEAVTNVARHAGVAAASVDLALLGDRALRVAVHDGGPAGAPWRPGIGLTSMRERVEQIGGSLTVDSGEEGSTVIAEIPLDVAP
ncbi:sensor histidine kinase [Dactylosporangium sp. CA-139066]|uniref:sensor histidine kinase n=1 Tax=Dactylosporangium sp. CA-139066 TaxID=3239930 RepID=UPI003D8FAF57